MQAATKSTKTADKWSNEKVTRFVSRILDMVCNEETLGLESKAWLCLEGAFIFKLPAEY